MADGRDYTVRLDGNREIKPLVGAKSIQKADMDQNGAIDVFDLVSLRKTVISERECGQILLWEEEKPVTAIPVPVTTVTTTTVTAPASKKDFIKAPVADTEVCRHRER